MPKEIMVGARPLLKKPAYTWWPPKEYKDFVVGRFDIYPPNFDEKLNQKNLQKNEQLKL